MKYESNYVFIFNRLITSVNSILIQFVKEVSFISLEEIDNFIENSSDPVNSFNKTQNEIFFISLYVKIIQYDNFYSSIQCFAVCNLFQNVNPSFTNSLTQRRHIIFTMR